ncbi:MAG: hypothetical protein RLZZ01_2502 [Actinomycetota bacterium]
MASRVSAAVTKAVAASLLVVGMALVTTALLAQGPAAADPLPSRPAATTEPSTDEERPTRPTINQFYPEERPLSDCLSSLPKPNCGSDARGGWRQLAVLGAILGGLGFIAWRIVATARRARPDRTP